MWIRTGSSGGLLLTRRWTLRLYKRRGTSQNWTAVSFPGTAPWIQAGNNIDIVWNIEYRYLCSRARKQPSINMLQPPYLELSAHSMGSYWQIDTLLIISVTYEECENYLLQNLGSHIRYWRHIPWSHFIFFSTSAGGCESLARNFILCFLLIWIHSLLDNKDYIYFV